MNQRVEYESTIGCLQSIVDRNIGCDFVFGGDCNVSKVQTNANTAIVDDFCSKRHVVA